MKRKSLLNSVSEVKSLILSGFMHLAYGEGIMADSILVWTWVRVRDHTIKEEARASSMV